MDLFFSFLFVAVLIPICIGGISMAPWVPTKSADIKRLIGLLHLKKDQKFLEIGCGDGRVSYSVAKAFPGAKITGIEIAFPVFIVAYFRKLL